LDASEREKRILRTAQEDGEDVIIVVEEEGGSGGKESAQATVSNLSGFRVKRDRPIGDKALRADPASDQWNNGCFRIVEGPWNADYIDEMEYFPLSTFKDQGDATSGAFAFLTKKRRRIGALRG
jgi:predicted phage terminase large subunit-like protein